MKQPIIAKGIRKYTGLMFRSSNTNPLIFYFDKPVSNHLHSIFVFFSFTAIWTFADGTTEERIIKPFQGDVKPLKPYVKLEEYPITKENFPNRDEKEVEKDV